MKTLNILVTGACCVAALFINGCAATPGAATVPGPADTPAQAQVRAWAASCYTADSILQAGVAYAKVHGLTASQKLAIGGAAETVAAACVTPPTAGSSANVVSRVQAATQIVAAIAGVQVPN